MVLLDSCFFIDLFAEDAGAVAKLEEFDWRDASVATLTVTEVGRGIEGSNRDRFESIVDRIDVLPYGLPEARRANTEHRRLQREGRAIGAVDAMIAATAIEANKTVVTRNVSEFRRTNASVTPY
ncbi:MULTISPECIES: type II toxin-antitoxin system VapC family toxin [Natrialba]|uniref:Ribonuclease VapC n=1 Tax=Natrialba swarupiae TaxID=2448032 RepID=A0A5D5AJ73_9EURY|nr:MULTISPECIES: type II toxin-antitoxin system VapC family toxin [Natrialba]MCW8172321.1 type II toxin-antitoxin system VapC family toxin [Natrialba swarupiae]MWV40476.1 PIN domain-containing protein [Natrialba sp. INN-245]TYT61204.1 type II toxin-antitoxin system VapC family toxin [Natrialba swarupiae]